VFKFLNSVKYLMKIDKKTVGTALTLISGIAMIGLAYSKNPIAGLLATLGFVGGLVLMKDE